MSEKDLMVKETSKEVKPQVTKKEENVNELVPGIKLIKDDNFVPRKSLTRDDIKKFNILEVEISSVFKEGRDPRINFKVYPFTERPYQTISIQGRKTNGYSRLFRLNGDISNNIRLSANEYTSILLSSKMPLEFKDKTFSMLKYARFITGISTKDGRRYNKVQLFLSFENVKTLWLSETELETISKLYQNNLIDPIDFYEVSTEELELDVILNGVELKGVGNLVGCWDLN